MATKQKKPVEVVVFSNPEKKAKRDPVDKSNEKSFQAAGSKSKSSFSRGKGRQDAAGGSTDPPAPSFVYDQTQAKYDVRKLAIQSMKHTAKDKAMVDLLVELGAKRPKNKCLHPRDYVEQLKRKRIEEREQELANGEVGASGKKKAKKPKKRDKDDLLGSVDGQKGWYRDGVQYVGSLQSKK